MTLYRLELDLIGSTTTQDIEAPDAQAAAGIASLMFPEARSITVAGIATTPATIQT